MPDVWLVGAAHIGNKSYYTDLQKLLDGQDAVLYEGVHKKEGLSIPGEGSISGTNTQKPAKSVYETLSDALGLDFQLQDINYRHKNWINSDLTLEELDALNKQKTGGQPNQFSMVEQLLDPSSPTARALGSFLGAATPGTREAIKVFLIEKLPTIDPNTAFADDPATREVILTKRNESVMDAFSRELKGTPTPRSIAIFYGAMHQEDLENQLIRRFGYADVETRWFTAATADKSKVDATGKMIIDALDKQMAPPKK